MSKAATTPQPIRAARLEDADEVASILAEAFADDPVMKWMFGSARPFHKIFFELARGLYLKPGFGHLAVDCGATLWLPAGEKVVLPLANELRILGAALPSGGFSAIRRAKKTGDVMQASHPSSPHYYLFAIGVRDNMKGKGIGGRLIREGLKRADENQSPAYLENSSPMNTPLYERLGFQAIAPLGLAAGAPPLLGMLRPFPGTAS